MKDIRVEVRLHDIDPREQLAGPPKDPYTRSDPWVRVEYADWNPISHGLDLVECPAGIRGVSIWDMDGRLLQWSGLRSPTSPGDTIHIPGFDIATM